MTKTAIMGFGNPCRSDDAVGIYVIDKIKEELGERDDISIFDMGTSSFEVLFNLKGHDKIIIVDAVVNTGEDVGTIYRLPASEIVSAVVDDPMVFLHGLKWDQALSYAKKIMQDEYPEDIHVFLVAVDNTKLDVQISDQAMIAGDKLAQIILNEELKIEV